jgi:hypothetical protein
VSAAGHQQPDDECDTDGAAGERCERDVPPEAHGARPELFRITEENPYVGGSERISLTTAKALFDHRNRLAA